MRRGWREATRCLSPRMPRGLGLGRLLGLLGPLLGLRHRRGGPWRGYQGKPCRAGTGIHGLLPLSRWFVSPLLCGFLRLFATRWFWEGAGKP